MTSKQRANLRSLAASIEPTFQIGKGDITDNQISGISDALQARELIKINVLRSCSFLPKEAAAELGEKTRSEIVAVTGNKIVLYRRSDKDGVKHIEF